MVTVQSSPRLKLMSGLRTQALGPPETTAVWLPLTAQEMLYQAPLTVTGSLKTMLMFAATPTSVAVLPGFVLETVGGTSAGT